MPPKKSRKYVRKFPVCTRSNSKLICLPPEKVGRTHWRRGLWRCQIRGNWSCGRCGASCCGWRWTNDTLNEELTNPMWTKYHGTFDNELPNEDPAQLPAELSLKEPYDLFRMYIDDEVLDLMVQETVRCARTKAEKPVEIFSTDQEELLRFILRISLSHWRCGAVQQSSQRENPSSPTRNDW